MKHLKTLLSVLAILVVVGCSSDRGTVTSGRRDSSTTLQIVATQFPTYDFARQIAGDKAVVTKLSINEYDVRDFEPTDDDIDLIEQADLFIFSGDEIEPWAQRTFLSLDDRAYIYVVDTTVNIPLREMDNHGFDIEDENNTHAHHHHGHEHYVYDPFVWTSPVNAKMMVEDILNALITVDPENEDYYQTNAQNYLAELDELDESFRKAVNEANRDTIYHAGSFAMHYLMDEYGIHYLAEPHHASPSTVLILQMIEEMSEHNTPALFYDEVDEEHLAKAISIDTDSIVLLLHSLREVSDEDIEAGVTYLSLMEQNLINLQIGLS